MDVIKEHVTDRRANIANRIWEVFSLLNLEIWNTCFKNKSIDNTKDIMHLSQENARLKSELDRTRLQIQDLNYSADATVSHFERRISSPVSFHNSPVKDMSDLVKSLQMELDEKNKIINYRETRIGELTDEIKSIEINQNRLIQNLERQLESAKGKSDPEVGWLQSRIEDLTKENEMLRNQSRVSDTSQISKIKDDYEFEITRLQTQNQSLRQRLNDQINQQLERGRGNSRATASRRSGSAQPQGNLEEQLKREKERSMTFYNALKRKEKECEERHSNFPSNSHSSLSSVHKEKQQLEERIVQLLEDNRRLKSNISNLETSYSLQKEKLSLMHIRNQSPSRSPPVKLNELEAKNKRLQDKITSLQADNSDLKDEIAHNRKLIQEYKARIQKADNSSIKGRIEELIREAENRVSEGYMGIENRMKVLEDRSTLLASNFNEFMDSSDYNRLDQLRSDLAQERRRNRELEQEVFNLYQRPAGSEEIVKLRAENEEKGKAIAEMNEKIRGHIAKMQGFTDVKLRLKARISEVQRAKLQVEARCQELEERLQEKGDGEIRQVQEKYRKCVSALKRAKEKIEVLEKGSIRALDLTKENEALSQKNVQLEQQLYDKQRQIQNLEQSVNQLSISQETSQSHTQNLQTSYSSLEIEIRKLRETVNEKEAAIKTLSEREQKLKQDHLHLNTQLKQLTSSTEGYEKALIDAQTKEEAARKDVVSLYAQLDREKTLNQSIQTELNAANEKLQEYSAVIEQNKLLNSLNKELAQTNQQLSDKIEEQQTNDSQQLEQLLQEEQDKKAFLEKQLLEARQENQENEMRMNTIEGQIGKLLQALQHEKNQKLALSQNIAQLQEGLDQQLEQAIADSNKQILDLQSKILEQQSEIELITQQKAELFADYQAQEEQISQSEADFKAKLAKLTEFYEVEREQLLNQSQQAEGQTVQDLRDQLHEVEKQLFDYEQKLSDDNSAFQKLQEDAAKFQKLKQQLEEEIARLKTENLKKAEQVKNVSAQVEGLASENLSLIQKIDGLNDENEQLKLKASDFDQLVQQQTQEIAALAKQRAEIYEELQLQEEQFQTQLKQMEEGFTEKINKLTQFYEEERKTFLQQKQNSEEKTISELRDQLHQSEKQGMEYYQSAQKQQQETDHLRQKYQDTRKREDELRNEFETLKEDNKNLKNRIHELQKGYQEEDQKNRAEAQKLQKQISQLTQTIQSNNDQLSSNQTEKVLLEQHIENLKQEVLTLKSQNNDLAQSIDDLKIQLTNSSAEKGSLEKDLTYQLNQKSIELSNYQNTIETLNAQILQLENKNENQKSEINDLTEDCKTYKQELITLQTQLIEKEAEITSASSNLHQELSENIQNLTQSNTLLTQQNDQLKISLQERTEEIEEFKSQITAMQESLVEQAQKVEAKELANADLLHQFKDAEQKVKVLETTLQMHQQSKSQLESEFNEQQVKFQEALQRVHELQTEVTKINQQNASYQQTIQELQKGNEGMAEMQKRLESIEQENIEKQQQIADLQQKADELEETKEYLKVMQESLGQQAQKVEEREQANADLSIRCQQAETNVKVLEEDIKILYNERAVKNEEFDMQKEKFEEALQQITRLQGEVEQVKDENERYLQSIKELEKGNESIVEMQKRLSEAEKVYQEKEMMILQLQERQEELQGVREEMQALQESLAEYSQQLYAKEETNADLSLQYQQASTQIQQLQQDLATHHQQKSELEESLKQISNLQSQLSQISQENQSYQETIKNLQEGNKSLSDLHQKLTESEKSASEAKQELSKLYQVCANYEEEIQDLENKLHQASQSQNSDEIDQLKTFIQSLQEQLVQERDEVATLRDENAQLQKFASLTQAEATADIENMAEVNQQLIQKLQAFEEIKDTALEELQVSFDGKTDEWNSEKAYLEEAVTRLEKKMHDMEHMLEEKELELIDLRQEVSSSNSELAVTQGQMKEIQLYKTKSLALEEEGQSLRLKLEREGSVKADLAEENEKLKEELTKLGKLNEQLYADNAVLRNNFNSMTEREEEENVEKLKLELQEFRAQKEQLEEQLQESSQKFEEKLMSVVSSYDEDLQQLRESLKQAKAGEQEKVQKLTKEMEILKKVADELRQKQSQDQTMAQQREQAQKQHMQILSQDYEHQIDTLSRELSVLRDSGSESRSIDISESENQQLFGTISKLHEQIDEQENTINMQLTQINILREEIRKMRQSSTAAGALTDIDNIKQMFQNLVESLPTQGSNNENMINILMNVLNFNQEEQKAIQQKRGGSGEKKGLKGLFGRKKQNK